MKKLVMLFCCFISGAGFSGTQEGKITEVLVRQSDGLHYFFMSGTASNKPSCAINTYWMIKDENSLAGKSQFSMVLTAYASGKTVRIDGTGACTRWSDGEDINVIYLR